MSLLRPVPALCLLALASASMAQSGEDAEHRADRLRTQQLNRDAAAAVARRDRGRAETPLRSRSYAGDRNAENQRRYQAARAQYEEDMAEWRRRVEACRAGYYDACAYR